MAAEWNYCKDKVKITGNKTRRKFTCTESPLLDMNMQYSTRDSEHVETRTSSVIHCTIQA